MAIDHAPVQAPPATTKAAPASAVAVPASAVRSRPSAVAMAGYAASHPYPVKAATTTRTVMRALQGRTTGSPSPVSPPSQPTRVQRSTTPLPASTSYPPPIVIKRAGPGRLQRVEGGPMADADYDRNVPSGSDLEKWKPIWSGIDPNADDATKLNILITRFKANAVGFTYVGASRDFSLAGDCGSLVRTFIAIAKNLLQIEEIRPRYHNGSPGWYVGPGFHEIDAARNPNMDNGGYYFKTSHVWADAGGTIFDVLFGETGQNGRTPDAGQYVIADDGSRTWHFQIGNQWYRAVGETNTYVATDAPA
jgi:hypothetical protein